MVVNAPLHKLSTLAQNATDDETITSLTQRMNELEKQKQEAEGLLYDVADDEEGRKKLELELNSFEGWAQRVRSDRENPEFVASYEHLRNAVRTFGIKVMVYSTQGE